MTEEKKKPEEDEVTEEKLDEVVGGAVTRPQRPGPGPGPKPRPVIKEKPPTEAFESMDREGTIE